MPHMTNKDRTVKYHTFSSEEGKMLEDRIKILKDNCSIIHRGALDVEYTDLPTDIVIVSGDIDEICPCQGAKQDPVVINYNPKNGYMSLKLGIYRYRIVPKTKE